MLIVDQHKAIDGDSDMTGLKGDYKRLFRELPSLALKYIALALCLPFILFFLYFCNPRYCGTMPRRQGIRCSQCDLEMPSKSRSINHQKASSKPLIWTASMKSQPTRPSFLDLPRELRDQIYGLAVQESNNIHLGSVVLDRWSPHHWHPDIRLVGSCWRSDPIPPRALITALLAVSKQLHVEASGVLYGQNTFSLTLALNHKLRRAFWRKVVIRRLTLDDMMPIAPRYHHFIRELALQPASPCMPPDIHDFLDVTSSLLARIPGAYFGFAEHSGQVGAATYCKLCEAMTARDPNLRGWGAFEGVYMIKPRQGRDFFAGWTTAARPTWAAELAEPARAIETSTCTLAELEPVTNALAYWNPSIRQKMFKEAVEAGQMDQDTCAATSSGSWYLTLDFDSAGSKGLHSAV